MKIILIRHGKPNQERRERMTAQEYNAFLRETDESAPLDVRPLRADTSQYRIFCAPTALALQTAKGLLGEDAVIETTDLLREVPLAAMEQDATKRSEQAWRRRALALWKKNADGIEEGRAETMERAKKLVDRFEEEDRDVIAIGYEHMNRMLFKILEKRGYLIERSHIFAYDYLEKARASKRMDHCGACAHNCLLTNPGCDVGREAAHLQITSKKGSVAQSQKDL